MRNQIRYFLYGRPHKNAAYNSMLNIIVFYGIALWFRRIRPPNFIEVTTRNLCKLHLFTLEKRLKKQFVKYKIDGHF